MEKGTNFNVAYLLRYIGPEKVQELEIYTADMLTKNYISFASSKHVESFFNDNLENFIKKLSLEEQKTIRSYTGYHFREINAILRNNWNYDVNGKLTPEIQNEYRELSDNIRGILNKAPQISNGIKVYRGVSILAFQSYGIFSLDDLVYLQDKYLYEEGFTSTSLIAEKSFCYTEVYTLTGKPNIQIEYLIPAGSDDGVALLDEALSYSPNQEEFLIKNSSLFKVLDVKVDSTNNVAFLQVMLIPERIWNYPDYEKEKQDIQTLK